MNPSKRLQAARLKRGTSREEVANRVGLSKEWYWDLEDAPGQLLGNVWSAHLQVLGDPVRVSPLELITGSDDLGAEPVDSWEIVELLERYRPSTG